MVERDLGAPGPPRRVADPPGPVEGRRPRRDSETGRVLRWEFDSEAEALAMVKRLLAADAGGSWRKQAGDAASPRLSDGTRPAGDPSPRRSAGRPGSRGQELQVLSMLCRADFSDDCRVSPQLYFTVIHILRRCTGTTTAAAARSTGPGRPWTG